MHHALKFFALEDCLHCLAIGHIDFFESECRITHEDFQARMLECRVVIGIQVIESHDFVAALEQQARGVKTDKAGGAGHEQLHNLRHTVLPADALSSSARICSCATVSSSLALITTKGSSENRLGRASRAPLCTVSDSALKMRLPWPPVIAKYTSARRRASKSAP